MPDVTESTFEQKVAAFRATADLNNPQARTDFAASRAEVILPLINEQSTIRAIFRVERLVAGADARYDLPFEDIECTWVMPNIGGIPTVQIEGSEIHVDTFGIDGAVEYQIDVAKDGRFQVAQLSTTLLKNRFIRQEEMAGWSLIRTHAAVLPATQKLLAFKDPTSGSSDAVQIGSSEAGGKLNVWTINDLMTMADQIGIGGRRVTDIYVSPRRYGDIRNQIVQQALPMVFRSDLYKKGTEPELPTQDTLRVHKVYNRTLVSDKKGYAFTQKDGFYYGVMPVREELNTRDNPISILEWKIGIMGRERVGFGVLDDKGLIEVTFDGTNS